MTKTLDTVASTQALRNLAHSERLLVALDFDGTLAPLVDDPARSRMHPDARRAILRLLDVPRTRVALVSGRSLESLVAVADVPESVLMVGSHGGEMRLDEAAGEESDGSGEISTDALAELEELRTVVGEVAGSTENVWVESKPAGVALHTRLAADGDARRVEGRARRAVNASLPRVSIREGKDVLEFSVLSADKGAALEHLRCYIDADAVFFAGDDVTDEDAFATLRSPDVGVKCGAGPTAAAYRVADPAELAAVLGALATVREGDAH